MAGLLDLFKDDKTTLGKRLYASGHSRKNAGDSIEVDFVNYNVVGAAQELFTNISAPLPYTKQQIDTQSN